MNPASVPASSFCFRDHHRRHPRVATGMVAGLLAAALMLGGCSLFGPSILFGGKATLEVGRVADRANGDSPIAVDLVTVYDAKLEERLATVKASVWFASERASIARVFPRSAFRVWSWEWVPGQEVAPAPRFSYRRGARTTFLFANYATPGDHRWRVAPNRSLQLSMELDDFTVSSAK